MLIKRQSPMTGEWHEQEIAVTQVQMDAYESGTAIQVAMPNISPDEREFILTGATAEDWATIFDEDEG